MFLTCVLQIESEILATHFVLFTLDFKGEVAVEDVTASDGDRFLRFLFLFQNAVMVLK